MSDNRTLLLTPASSIPARRQKWFWQDRVPLGTATIFAGAGGEGKSTFALYLSALAIRGELQGDLKGHKTSILIVSHEDDWGTVMNPRLMGAGADLDRVFKLSIAATVDEVTAETVPALPMDLNLIRQAVADTGARVIIFDPITSTIGGDLYKVSDVRRALDPLAALAQELDLAVICIMHFNKGMGNASNKLSGSHAFRDVVRSLLLFATDDETGQRVVTVDKSNYSKERGASFAFNLVSALVPTDDGEIADVGTVEFLGDTDVSVSDIINRGIPDTEDASDSDDAAAWLSDYLTSVGGSSPKRDVENAAKREHYSDKVLRRAREKAGVVTARQGFPSTTVWSLPVAPSDAQSRPLSEAGMTGPEWGTTATDKEEAPVSYLDHRPEIAARAGMFCPVCEAPSGTNNPGYCDTTDNAHANHRADAAAGVIA